MGIYSGNMTASQFFYFENEDQVVPENPYDFIKEFAGNIKDRTIRPLGKDGDSRAAASGWCHPTKGSPEFSPSEHVAGNGLILGLRLDEKKIPTSTFRYCYQDAIDAMIGDNKEDKLPKKAKDAVRERLTQELLQHALPTTKVYEAYIDTDRRVIHLFASSKIVQEKFCHIFYDTFGISLFRRNAGTICIQNLTEAAELEPYLDSVPAQFIHIQTGRIK